MAKRFAREDGGVGRLGCWRTEHLVKAKERGNTKQSCLITKDHTVEQSAKHASLLSLREVCSQRDHEVSVRKICTAILFEQICIPQNSHLLCPAP